MLFFAQASGPSKFATLIDSVARTPLSEIVLFAVFCTLIRLALHPYLMRTPAHRRGGFFKFGRFSNEILDAIIYSGVFVFLLVRPFGLQTFNIPSESMYDTLKISDYLVINKAVYRYSSPQSGDVVVFRPPLHACSLDQIEEGQPKVDFIKRCIGAPGQIIEIRRGQLYVNGKPADESFRKGSNQFDFKLVKYEGSYAPFKGRYIPVTIGPSGEPNYAISGLCKEYSVGLNESSLTPGSPAVGEYNFKDWNELSSEERNVLQELREAPAAAVPQGFYLMMGDNRENSFDGRVWGLVPRSDVVGRAEFIWLPTSRIRKIQSVAPAIPQASQPLQ